MSTATFMVRILPVVVCAAARAPGRREVRTIHMERRPVRAAFRLGPASPSRHRASGGGALEARHATLTAEQPRDRRELGTVGAPGEGGAERRVGKEGRSRW